MALDAGPFIRTGTRGSPSCPGSNPETGYVDADCSDRSAEAACRRGGPYVDGTLCGLAVDDRRRRARFAACVLPHLNIERVVDALQRPVPVPQVKVLIRILTWNLSKSPRVRFGASGFPAFAGTMAVERVATGFRWAEGPVYFP